LGENCGIDFNIVSDFTEGGWMNIVKKLFRSKQPRNASTLQAPTSLLAFAQLNSSEQSLLAQTLLAETVERRSQQQAS
jgi:hypothetical protein